MGTSIYPVNQFSSVKDFAEQQLQENYTGYKLASRSIFGSQVYSLYQHINDDKRFIALDLVNKTSEGWTHKALTESDGPVYLDCPVGLLNKSNCDSPYAVAWRNKCLSYRKDKEAKKTATSKLKSGSSLVLTSDKSTVLFDRAIHGTPRMFIGTDTTGKRWRYNINDICINSIQRAIQAESKHVVAVAG